MEASPALKFLPASCSLSGLSLCVLKLTPKPPLPPRPQEGLLQSQATEDSPPAGHFAAHRETEPSVKPALRRLLPGASSGT